MIKPRNAEATLISDAGGNDIGSGRPFWVAFPLGLAKIVCVFGGAVAVVVACWQAIYALGWSGLWALGHNCTQCRPIPATAWFLAADSDPFLVLAGVTFAVLLAFASIGVVIIAAAGGWRLPAWLRSSLEAEHT